MKDDAMSRVSQEGRARFHRLKETDLAFDTQVNREIGFVGDVAHQGRRLMRVEVIDDKMPLDREGRAFHRALDMFHKVLLVAGRTAGNRRDTTGGHLEIDDERQRAMSNIFRACTAVISSVLTTTSPFSASSGAA